MAAKKKRATPAPSQSAATWRAGLEEIGRRLTLHLNDHFHLWSAADWGRESVDLAAFSLGALSMLLDDAPDARTRERLSRAFNVIKGGAAHNRGAVQLRDLLLHVDGFRLGLMSGADKVLVARSMLAILIADFDLPFSQTEQDAGFVERTLRRQTVAAAASAILGESYKRATKRPAILESLTGPENLRQRVENAARRLPLASNAARKT